MEKKETNKKAKPAKPKTVKMVNESGKVAEVHPSEVENYKAGGWSEK
jgi:hypothetical protein